MTSLLYLVSHPTSSVVGRTQCWMCKQACARAGLTFRFRHFGIFRDARTFVSPLLAISRTYLRFASVFSLVLYSFKPPGVYLLLLYTLVIFPSVSVCVIEAEF